MEMELTLHWMPSCQPITNIHRQMLMDGDTCTSLESWLVSTQLEDRALLRLLQKTQAIPQTHMIVWWIRFLTRESLACLTTGNVILSTWLLFSDDTIISRMCFLKKIKALESVRHFTSPTALYCNHLICKQLFLICVFWKTCLNLDLVSHGRC